MAKFNVFATRGDQTVEIYSVERDWTRWICLNATAEVLPNEINLHKDFPDRDWENEQILPSGRYKDVDWACEPDWFRLEHWWRGWIPVDAPDTCSLWYLDLDAPSPSEDAPRNRFVFPDKLRKEMHTTLRDLQAAVDDLIMQRILGHFLPGPPAYDVSILDGTFITLQDLRREGANTKRAALDRAGWIRWWLAACEDGYFITPESLSRVLHSELGELHWNRGYVIDLCKDWKGINLLQWFYHHMPLFYPWGFDEINDPRFSRMNPDLIALAYDDDAPMGTDTNVGLDEKLEAAAEQSWAYDDYLSAI
ncbi:hypothetical protein M413DRAFT_51410, partial [Hebeloma cylindrosporum]